MVNVQILLRGIKHRQDEMLKEISEKHYHYVRKDKDGNDVECWVQGSVRQYWFGEITIPEDCLEDLYKDIWPVAWKRKFGFYSLMFFVLRKLMGLKKMPKFDVKPSPAFNRDGVECVGIGIKHDIVVDGIEKL